jgi:general secretion pathway protein A
LAQRIAVRAVISPLAPEESVEYIRHRLARAGCARRIPFTRMAVKAIVRHARGIPRIINILCDNALITAFGYRQEKVNAKIVKEVIIDRKRKKGVAFPRWAIALLFLLMVIAAGLWFSSKMPGAILIGKSVSF